VNAHRGRRIFAQVVFSDLARMAGAGCTGKYHASADGRKTVTLGFVAPGRVMGGGNGRRPIRERQAVEMRTRRWQTEKCTLFFFFFFLTNCPKRSTRTSTELGRDDLNAKFLTPLLERRNLALPVGGLWGISEKNVWRKMEGGPAGPRNSARAQATGRHPVGHGLGRRGLAVRAGYGRAGWGWR